MLGKVILHSVLVVITGGVWLIPLIVYAIFKKR